MDNGKGSAMQKSGREKKKKNLGEREKMFHVGNGNGKGLLMGMYSMVQSSKKTCGDGEE